MSLWQMNANGIQSGYRAFKVGFKVKQRRSARVHIAQPTKDSYESDGEPGGTAHPEFSYSKVLPIDDLWDKLDPLPSPLLGVIGGFVGEDEHVMINTVHMFEQDEFTMSEDKDVTKLKPWVTRAGPRSTVRWDPKETTAAIVTCGGLCPGLNDVIQALVLQLLDYGVPDDQIIGIRYGLRGFYEKEFKPWNLTRESVQGIQLKGGTILGTSRGGSDIEEIVRRCQLWGVNMVFVIGGNGGNAAANAINNQCQKVNWPASVVGIPKSIDNDILIIDRCFGFQTAVDQSQHALLAAHVEAKSADRGVGLVKLMGRQSGFIAMDASLASGVVDICLIPEVDFEFEPFLAHVKRIVDDKGYCVVCAAEGAGQKLFAKKEKEYDKSGNPKLVNSGILLRKLIKDYFNSINEPVDMKYIDPSYMIRSTPTIPQDRVYCRVLGNNAVHGAFAGYTGFTVGLVNTHYVYLPIEKVIAKPRVVNPRGRQWNRLKSVLKQPDLLSLPEVTSQLHQEKAGAP